MDAAVYNYLKTVADGSVKAGISTATLQNGGVGLALCWLLWLSIGIRADSRVVFNQSSTVSGKKGRKNDLFTGKMSLETDLNTAFDPQFWPSRQP